MVSQTVVRYLTLLLCLFYIGSVWAQNLIKNPSFEDFVSCPTALGNLAEDVPNWSTPTEGSTDYFNGCSETMGTPNNFNGTQPADFGNGYAGLYLYAPDDYREYLQAELQQPLIKGQTYRVSFYISLAERSDFAVKEFGVLFSKYKMQLPGKKELSAKKRYTHQGNDYHYMEIGYSNFYADTKDWVLVYTQFEAKGSEHFMTLGNFKSNSRTRLFKTKRQEKRGAYYYIDMVMVERVEAPTLKNGANKTSGSDSYELDKVHIFENLLFEFDKFQLSEPAKKEIQPLYQYLQKNSGLTISINGHTDSIGSNEYNNKLSSARAEAVAAYLQKLGISKSRIVWQGFGGQKPMATNDSETGRRQNRRVEFVITKNRL